MSAQQALDYIRHIRSHSAARADIEAILETGSLAQLVALGAQAGFHFSPRELQSAHGLDWSMRAHLYSSRAGQSGSENDTQL
ncbi:MAG: Nif11-like leader peptide family natural product precursor [Pseudomonadota bacterium]